MENLNELKPVGKLSPFAHFCCTIGNLPASYMISLTYEEQLLWLCNYLEKTVIPAVNTNAEAVAELQNLYVILKNYVDNYFDNLDVQEEINNKLDKMVEDGTLNNLILPIIENKFTNFENKTNEDLNSFKENVNSQISTMDQKVNNISSGSPAGVYDTLDDLINANPDHSKIYLTKNNGHWNYWNGTTFVSGGVYQSEYVSANSINFTNLNEKMQNSLSPEYNVPNDNIIIIDSQLEADGSIQTIVPSNIKILKKFVAPGDLLYLNFDFDKLSYSVEGVETAIYGFFDSQNNPIKIIKTSTQNNNHNYTETNVEVPNNASYIICNLSINYIPHFVISSNTSFSQKNKINYDMLDDNLKNIINLDYTQKINGDYLSQNAVFTTQGDLVALNNFNIKKYEIKPNTYYLLKNARNSYSTDIVYGIASTQSEYTKQIGEKTITYKTPIKIITGNYEGEKIENYYFKSPSYAKYLYATTTSINDTGIELFEGKPKQFEIENKLKNKNIIYDGDSICEGRTEYKPNGGAYAQLIANITNSIFKNYAISGATLSSVIDTPLEGTKHSVCDNLINLETNGDIYCFEGGYNDYALNIELGEITPDFTSELNIKTVCGALEHIFRYSITNFLGKPICFILVHKISNETYLPNQKGKTWSEYHDSMLKICKKYSIPVYDAFNDSGLNGWNIAQNNEFLFGDGTHPNENGYKKYYVPQILDLYNKII